jgi:hypothetical protein
LLKLNVRVGQTIAVGGPTNIRVEQKSGQTVSLVFDADRSVPIRIVGFRKEEPLGIDGREGEPSAALSE